MQQLRLGDGRDRFDRRAFCKAVGAATAVGVVEASLGSALAHADLYATKSAFAEQVKFVPLFLRSASTG